MEKYIETCMDIERFPLVVTCYSAAMPGAAPCHYVQHLLRGEYRLDSQWVLVASVGRLSLHVSCCSVSFFFQLSMSHILILETFRIKGIRNKYLVGGGWVV